MGDFANCGRSDGGQICRQTLFGSPYASFLTDAGTMLYAYNDPVSVLRVKSPMKPFWSN